MTQVEQRWARHLLAAFAPPGSTGLAPAEGEVDPLTTFLTLLRASTPKAALGLRLALWLAALSPLWLWGKLTTFSGLALPRRTQILRELLGHRSFAVRELTTLLKFCAAMALLGDPAVRARSGFDNVQASAEGESGMRVRLRVVGQAASEPVRVWPAGDGPAEEVELPQEVG